MSKNSAIEWTHHTFNPWWGCTKVSAGCKHCYAEAFAHRFKTEWGINGVRKEQSEKYWRQPIHWNASAKKSGKRFRVFCGSMCDIFENNPQVEEWRDRVMTLALRTPYLDWLFLTKRPEFAAEWLAKWQSANLQGELYQHNKLPPHFWVGVSVENQKAADERIPHLLRIPAQTRFLSCEPLLGNVNLEEYMMLTNGNDSQEHHDKYGWSYNSYSGGFAGPGAIDSMYAPESGISWVIAGGESGPKARPMHPDWARGLRDQCSKAAVPFFFKQWGEYIPEKQLNGGDYGTKGAQLPGSGLWFWKLGKKKTGRLLDNHEWNQIPASPASAFDRFYLNFLMRL